MTYFQQLSEIDDTALKVFRKDDPNQGADDVPPLKSYVSSCHALKEAVTTLYNMGDGTACNDVQSRPYTPVDTHAWPLELAEI